MVNQLWPNPPKYNKWPYPVRPKKIGGNMWPTGGRMWPEGFGPSTPGGLALYNGGNHG